MAKRILVLQGHPDPAGRHLLHAMADAYAQGAASGGHEIRHIDIAKLDFPLLRTAEDFEKGEPPAALAPAVADLLWAEHIVILFPLWLGTMPALLKGFLEQVMRPHVAFAYTDRGMPKKLLAGRSARIVMTMGMPVFAYRWFFGAHGLKGLERSILKFVGIKPVRETLFGMLGSATPETRRKWIEGLRDLGTRGA